MQTQPKKRRQSVSRAATDSAAKYAVARRVKRKSTAWDDIPVEPALPSANGTIGTTLAESGVDTDPLTEIRRVEFTLWDEDPKSQELRKALLFLCWTTIVMFASIPCAFTIVYASTFSDKVALEWY